MKKPKTNDAIKREIFENLEHDRRYYTLSMHVAASLYCGQEPTVVESWNTYYQRSNQTPENYLTEDELAQLNRHLTPDTTIEARGQLDATAEHPYASPQISFSVMRNRKEIFRITKPAPMTEPLVYYGFRDKNYCRLFFRQLGYHTEEGIANNRRGVLISLKD